MTTNEAEPVVSYEWTIADRLRKARELTGLNQEGFATRIGISKGTVSTYEIDPDAPHKPPFMLAWANGSPVTLEWLWTGQESGNSPPDGRPFWVTSQSVDNDRYPVAA
jgi:transcriptional regulator with XRE-family HTH domain